MYCLYTSYLALIDIFSIVNCDNHVAILKYYTLLITSNSDIQEDCPRLSLTSNIKILQCYGHNITLLFVLI